MQNSFNPTTPIQLVNALLPIGALPRIGHISAQPSEGRDAEAQAAQEERGAPAAPLG